MGIGARVGGNAAGVHAEGAGDINGAVEMVLLRNDQDAACMEHIPRPTDALKSGEPFIVAEDPILRYAEADSQLTHGGDLVVVAGAVAAQKEHAEARRIGQVDRTADAHAVGEHIAG